MTPDTTTYPHKENSVTYWRMRHKLAKVEITRLKEQITGLSQTIDSQKQTADALIKKNAVLREALERLYNSNNEKNGLEYKDMAAIRQAQAALKQTEET